MEMADEESTYKEDKLFKTEESVRQKLVNT